ncbi:MAG: helicase C-terminal domain-containing protein, partial [Nitrosotalea sp.]
PYASPQPYDNIEKNAWSSWRNSRTFRFMIRRMQQGIGRLVRTDNDPWGIVVVIDGRFNAQWNTIRTALPSYITDTKIISFVTRNRIVQSVLEQTNRLEGKFSIK